MLSVNFPLTMFHLCGGRGGRMNYTQCRKVDHNGSLFISVEKEPLLLEKGCQTNSTYPNIYASYMHPYHDVTLSSEVTLITHSAALWLPFWHHLQKSSPAEIQSVISPPATAIALEEQATCNAVCFNNLEFGSDQQRSEGLRESLSLDSDCIVSASWTWLFLTKSKKYLRAFYYFLT